MKGILKAAALLAVGAAAFVTLTIIVRASKRDHGFVQQPGCGDVLWERGSLPILVSLDPSAAGWETELDEAVALWSKVHPQLVMRGGDLPEELTGGSLVPVVAEHGIEDHGRATLTLHGCAIRAVRIQVPAETTATARRRKLAHEIGHALGLADDSDPGSVMHAISAPGDFDVTSKDQTALVQAYGLDE